MHQVQVLTIVAIGVPGAGLLAAVAAVIMQSEDDSVRNSWIFLDVVQLMPCSETQEIHYLDHTTVHPKVATVQLGYHP